MPGHRAQSGGRTRLNPVKGDDTQIHHRYRSLRLLLDTMQSGDGAPAHVELAPELIVRASTAPPPGG